MVLQGDWTEEESRAKLKDLLLHIEQTAPTPTQYKDYVKQFDEAYY